MKIILLVFFLYFSPFSVILSNADEDYQGRYADCNGTTDNGVSVTGECYMYSDQYGEFSGTTDNGSSVSGECYRYSGQYAELESVTTDSGENVSGECYIY